MKILLVAINAKYIHSNLAVYSLRVYAKKHKDSIELAEYTINHKSDDILRDIYKKRPDVLCFSCYIWNFEYAREIAAEFHKLRPEVPIWAGGPEVSYEAETFLADNPAISGVMIGEGEETFARLADYYCGGSAGALSDIAGIAYRADGAGCAIIKTPPRALLDLNALPFAYEDMDIFKDRIIYYESSRGCPFSCSYCLSSLDQAPRFRDLDLVKKELAFFIENEVAQVKFVDRTFNCSHAHAMAVWKFIKEHDRGITNFHFEIAADLLTGEELELLKSLRPGLVQLEIGVQSTNPETIAEIRRSMDLERVAKAVDEIGRAGNIHMHLDLIAGLPQEGFERFAQSFRDIYALKPHQLQLGFLKVLKGSYMHAHKAEYGILCHDQPPYEVMRTKWLSYDELLSVKLAEEMLEVYYNSGQFEVTMKLLDFAYGDSFGFFLELGRFYERNGYLGMSHSRIKRCEILLEFVTAGGFAPAEMIQESLLYDLYYRENMKSRPFWARNPAEFARASKVFCKNRTQSHIEPFFYHFPKKKERRIKELPGRLSEAVYVLFEYDKRDPLDHQAKTTEYDSREVEERCRNVQKRF